MQLKTTKMSEIKASTRSNLIQYSFILLISFLVHGIANASGLNGTYTINAKKAASASNYTSFNDADSDLVIGWRANGATANGPGVSAAVVFNIANGLYNETLDLKAISGTSSKNTVTFQSASGDSSKVILMDSSVGSYSYPAFCIYLDNVNFVKFYRMTFLRMASSSAVAASTATYDNVVLIENQSDSDSISNCRIISYYNPKGYYYGSLVKCGQFSYSVNNNNCLKNNYMSGGYTGIIWYGNVGTSTNSIGNLFDHNILDSIGSYGMVMEYQNDLMITNNRISLRYGGEGIYATQINSSSAKKYSLISNNFISAGSTIFSGYNAGIYAFIVDNTNIVYNSINIYGQGNGSYGGYVYNYSSPKALYLYNNNFINQNTGFFDYAIFVNDITSEDYNNIQNGASVIGSYNGTSYSNLAAWKKISGGNDVSSSPFYADNINLHASSPTINGKAKVLTYITSDIDGQTRDSKNPDIGADEFIPPAIKPIITAIINPTPGFCLGSQDVQIKLSNWGLDSLKSEYIQWSVNGVKQKAVSVQDTIVPVSSKIIDLGSYNFSGANTIYKVVAWIDSANHSPVTFAATADSESARSGLKGTFLIDNSGKGTPDYTSFRAAVNDLNTKGACGAIVFNVADGVYNESISLNKIPNASAVNTILFQSKSLDSSKVTLDTAWAPMGMFSYGYVIGLSGTSYITFHEMTIVNSTTIPGAYGNADAINITLGVNHASFTNDVISTSTSKYNYGFAVYDDPNAIDNYLNFINNHMSGGQSVLYMLGVYGTPYVGAEKGLVVQNCLIDSSAYRAVYMLYMDSTTFYGNVFNISSGYYAIQLDNYNIGETDTMSFINNFIAFNGTGANAIYLTQPGRMNFYDNSIYSNAGYTTTVINCTTGITGVNIEGNIFHNAAGAAALEIDNSGLKKADYNDLYTTGSAVASWNGTSYSNLAAWRTASGFDKNSVSIDPGFIDPSSANLHLKPSSLGVYHTGISLPDVSVDIDGQRRSKMPNIGADETTQKGNDAAITSIDSPATGFCSGIKNIFVNLYNAGTDTLKNVTINWTVNGTAMTPISWKGTLTSLSSTEVKVGSLSFITGSVKIIKSWTDSPNGAVDSNPANDTTSRMTGSGLSGTHTIGGTSPDYPSFRSAVYALNNIGLCGSVIFNVRDGSYNESILIKNVANSSPANTITFQSQSLDSTKVILDTAWGGTYYGRGYTIRLDGTNYITFRKMTISNYTISYTWADGIDLIAGASHNSFLSNLIYINGATTGASYGATIWDDPNTTESHNTFMYNGLSGGWYNFYCIGAPTKIGYEVGNIFFGNIMDSSYAAGIYASYLDSFYFANNRIITDGSYGLYMAQFGKNSVSNVVNNFITATGNYSYGIYSYNVPLLNVYFNSVNSSTSSAYYYTAYFDGLITCKINIENNIFVNDAGGEAIFASTNGLASSDYNDFYSSGSIGKWNATSCSALSNWQSATKMDKHSVSGDPMYLDPSVGDLHLTVSSSAVRHNGTSIAKILYDIDGQLRNSTKPDIGADELVKDSNDIGVSAIISPVNGSCGNKSTTVGVQVTNYGYNNEKSFKVTVVVNGSTSASTTVTKTLNGAVAGAPFIDTVYLSFSPALNTIAGGSYHIKAYTTLSTDTSYANDTAKALISLGTYPTAKFGIGKACVGVSTQFSNSSKAGSGSIATYAWSFGNGSYRNTANPTTTYANPGTYTIKMKVTNSYGCSDSTSKSVTIDTVNAHFTHSTPAADGSVNFNAVDLINNTAYSWDFGDGSAKGSGSKPSHQYGSDNTYTVAMTATGKSGCTSTIDEKITIVITGLEKVSDNGFGFEIYPNPFNDHTNINYTLDKSSFVKMTIYDLTGRAVVTLINSNQDIGTHHLNFDVCKNQDISPGSYIVQMQLLDRVITKQLIFVK